MSTAIDKEQAIRMPPMVPLPNPVVGAMFLTGRIDRVAKVRSKYGPAAVLRYPGVGDIVSVSDPDLAKQVFTAPADVLYGGESNPLQLVLGKNSMFGLDEDKHLRARRLLLPPFHGQRMGEYEAIFEEETLEAMKSWPVDRDFATMDSMMPITLNAIIRTVFGAEGKDYDELRDLLPDWVTLGSKLVVVPWMHRDFGRFSPWGSFIRKRRQYDAIVDRLIEHGRKDPRLADRRDILAMLLQAEYDDGSKMSRDEIADQLLTILTAGHETTAGSLSWAMERIRRHPKLLEELTQEARAGGSELREATLTEVQRTRPVIVGAFRYVKKQFSLGEWVLPPGAVVVVDVKASHIDAKNFTDPDRFSPKRFVGTKPGTYSWVPFGGGRRRCVGAAFALLEMNVVLRTILERADLVPTSEPDEKPLFRGVSLVPRRGGLARLRAIDLSDEKKWVRRAEGAESEADPLDQEVAAVESAAA